jgi:hypothetical protein
MLQDHSSSIEFELLLNNPGFIEVCLKYMECSTSKLNLYEYFWSQSVGRINSNFITAFATFAE